MADKSWAVFESSLLQHAGPAGAIQAVLLTGNRPTAIWQPKVSPARVVRSQSPLSEKTSVVKGQGDTSSSGAPLRNTLNWNNFTHRAQRWQAAGILAQGLHTVGEVAPLMQQSTVAEPQRIRLTASRSKTFLGTFDSRLSCRKGHYRRAPSGLCSGFQVSFRRDQ